MNETVLREESETDFSGALLRARREARGISLDEAVERTRIRRFFLAAMEEDRFGDLPGNAYVVGFLRSYAGFLGLDAVRVVEGYHQRFKRPVPRNPDDPATGTGLFHPALRKRFLLSAGLAAAAIALFFLMRLLFSRGPDQDSAPAVAGGSERDMSVAALAREPAVGQPVSPESLPKDSVAEDAVAGAADESGQQAEVPAGEPSRH